VVAVVVFTEALGSAAQQHKPHKVFLLVVQIMVLLVATGLVL
jgi:hypothetical protein